MHNRIANYIINGGDEKTRLLAEADYCAACAQREADDGDPIGMYAPLAEEAFRLRAEAEALS